MRLCVDVNVWIAHLIGVQFGRTDTASGKIIDIVRDTRFGDAPVQLVMSLEMIGTLEAKLLDRGFAEKAVEELTRAIISMMRNGPEGLDQYLLVSGRDQFAMRDREDAGVLATAIAAKANVLITDNLRDFRTKDAEYVETRMVPRRGGSRQLYTLLYERADGVALVIAHPIDCLEWFRQRIQITPSSIRELFAKPW